MEKSKLHNSLCPDLKKPKVEDKVDSRKMKMKRRNRSDNVPTFTGMEAHPSTTVTFMSKRKIVDQNTLHRMNVTHSKKETKRKRMVQQIREEKKREPKVGREFSISLLKFCSIFNLENVFRSSLRRKRIRMFGKKNSINWLRSTNRN